MNSSSTSSSSTSSSSTYSQPLLSRDERKETATSSTSERIVRTAANRLWHLEYDISCYCMTDELKSRSKEDREEIVASYLGVPKKYIEFSFPVVAMPTYTATIGDYIVPEETRTTVVRRGGALDVKNYKQAISISEGISVGEAVIKILEVIGRSDFFAKHHDASKVWVKEDICRESLSHTDELPQKEILFVHPRGDRILARMKPAPY